MPASSAHLLSLQCGSRIIRNLIDAGIEPTVAWLAFEILLGLAAFGLLIWWTLPRGKRDDKDGPPGP